MVVVAFVTIGYLVFRGMYGNEFVKEVYIPGTKYKAVAFVGNGGATTAFSTCVSFLDTADCLTDSDRGNVFNSYRSNKIDITLSKDTIKIEHDGDEKETRYKQQYSGVIIKVSKATTPASNGRSKNTVWQRYEVLRGEVDNIVSEQDNLVKLKGLQFHDKNRGQRIYLDSLNIFIRRTGGGFYKVKKLSKFDWNPFISPKSVTKVKKPSSILVEYNAFLLKHNILKMYWDENEVCYMKIGENGDWLWFSVNEKDSDYICKTFETSIGRAYTEHDNQVYIINSHWKYCIELK